MMNARRIATFALGISILSLGYAAWLQHRMETVLQRREREMVHRWAPKMRSFYTDAIAGTNAMPAEPETFEELFDPLFRLIDQIGDGAEREPLNQKVKAK